MRSSGTSLWRIHGRHARYFSNFSIPAVQRSTTFLGASRLLQMAACGSLSQTHQETSETGNVSPHTSLPGRKLKQTSSHTARSRDALDGLDTRSAAQTTLALEVARLTTAIGREMAQRERLNRELEIAQEVQAHFFPQRLPTVAGLDYCGHCRPAREVGGDYYDFLELPEGSLGIAVGDVSGKGIGAALMMASLEASLRGQASVSA